jgi:hypothetical protein
MNGTLPVVPATAYVDVVATGNILLISVDEDLQSSVLHLTPSVARQLGQMLISAADYIELPL